MVYTQVLAFGPAKTIIRPSRRGYLIGVILLAAALTFIVLTATGILSLTGQIRDFQRVRAPGTSEISFTQPGRYLIYLEERGQCCSYSVKNGPGPIRGWSVWSWMASASSGQLVTVSGWHGPTESYAVNGHLGEAAMDFTISRPGTYILSTKKVIPSAITDLAVGRDILPGLVKPALLILAGLGALAGAGLAFAITALRRRRWHRRAATFTPDPK